MKGKHRLLFCLLAIGAGACSTTASSVNFDVPPIQADAQPVPMRPRRSPKHIDIRPIIPVRFGTHVEDCLIDTGSGGSFFFKTNFSRALPTHGRMWHTGVGGGWIIDFNVKVASIDIGGRTWQDADFTLQDVVAPDDVPSCVIGMNLLVGNTLAFDFKSGRFQLLKHIPAGLKQYPLYHSPTGDILVPATIGSKQVWAMFDSGAEVTVVDTAEIQASPAEFEFVRTLSKAITNSSGEKVDTAIYKAPRVIVAGKPLPFKAVLGMDLAAARNSHPAMIVGIDVMVPHKWYFDLITHKWAME